MVYYGYSVGGGGDDMHPAIRALESYDFIFSRELFGMSKKKPNTQTPPNIEEVRKLPKYNRQLFEKCVKTFINAWNYKAYKLPSSLGKDDDGNEADEGVCFNDRIEPMTYTNNGTKKYYGLDYFEKTGKTDGGVLIIESQGIYVFAEGQPTEFELYWKVQKDICTRWKKRLEEKVPVVEKMLEEYPGIRVVVDCDCGDGDEGCVNPSYCIEIPINSMR